MSISIDTNTPTTRTHRVMLDITLTDNQLAGFIVATGGTSGWYKEWQELKNYAKGLEIAL